MKMKKLIGALLALVLLVGCATNKNLSPEKAKRMTETTQKVNEALNKQLFTIEVNHVYPQRLPAKALSYGYYVRVTADSVYSCLPYFGHAYRVPYGGGKGLNFAEKITDYVMQRGKDGKINIYFKVNNKEDRYDYRLEVFDNGRAFVDISSDERDRIGFAGMMDIGK